MHAAAVLVILVYALFVAGKWLMQLPERHRFEQAMSVISLSVADQMTDVQFEDFTRRLLGAQGYSCRMTPAMSGRRRRAVDLPEVH